MNALAARNLFFYWRGNLAVLLGVAVGTAVLAGALFVGDSLRGSLRERALRQAGGVTAAWLGHRLVNQAVAARLGEDCYPLLLLRGTVREEVTSVETKGGAARVTVLCLDAASRERFRLPTHNGAVLSHALAQHLKVEVGHRIQVSLPQLSAVPKASLLGKRNADDLTVTFTLPITAVLSAEDSANDFSLTPTPAAGFNLFLPLELVQDRLGQPGKVNAMLAFSQTAESLNYKLREVLAPADWGLRVHVPSARKAYISVESEEYVLSDRLADQIAQAAAGLSLRSSPTIVYLANWIASGDARVPYSIVAAVDEAAAKPLGPFLPEGIRQLRDDELVLADWADSPLRDVPIGSPIILTYFEPEIEGQVQETTARFKLAGRIPLSGVAADPDLTPPFPGITDKLTIGEWNPPFPFDSSRIKPNDIHEQFWERYRTTPKAYITLAAGRRLFASRFGVVTSVRVAPAAEHSPEQTAGLLLAELHKRIDPAPLGIRFEDQVERMRAMSMGSTDFGGLFLGFSLFLIAAALLLVILLQRLNIERRVRDLGLLLASGFTPAQVRRMLLWETAAVASAGITFGLLLALAYSRGLIELLSLLWPDQSARSILKPHASWGSAAAAMVAILLMTLAAVLLAVRGLLRLPIPAMLLGRVEAPQPAAWRRSLGGLGWGWGYILSLLPALAGIASIVAGTRQTNPDLRAIAFFSGGSLLLAAGLLVMRTWLRQAGGAVSETSSILKLGVRNARRFPGRSLLTVMLIATAAFLIVAVESFRRQPLNDSNSGFNLIAETDVPLFHPFDREPGRGDLIDLIERELPNALSGDSQSKRDKAEMLLAGLRTVMPLRVHRGDDASCLNLFQAGKPQVVGVPAALIERGGFQFSASLADNDDQRANPWLLLTQPQPDGAIPIIGEQNSVTWMLKKAVGDTLELPDERGTLRRFRIVATLQDSVFQSELLIAEPYFLELFPREEGYAMFLIEVEDDDARITSYFLERAFRRHGMIVTDTQDRVAAYQAIISTYLTTFQLLGALGLLLGVLGLAAVVLRNVWERLGEFALLQAIGFSTRNLRQLVLAENLALLAMGLGLGTAAAVLSTLPQGGALLARLPRLFVLLTLILAAGCITVLWAMRAALRVPIMPALRNQ